MKKLFIICALFLVFLSAAPEASAGKLVQLADSGILRLGLDKAWKKNYATDQGKLKVQFRRLRFPKEKGLNHHLVIWWDKERIADGYMPPAPAGYSIRIYESIADQRLFVNLETFGRSVVMGYDPKAKKLHKFIDSRNYYSPQPNPRIYLDQKRGDLILKFTGNNSNGGNPIEYRLFWDEKARWFGYEDISTYYVPPPPKPEPSYTPQPSYRYEPEPAASEVEVVTGSDDLAADSGEVVTGSNELFYDDAVVTGS